MTRPRAIAAAAAAMLAAGSLAGCTKTGADRDLILVDCAERAGVDWPINLVWLDRPRPGAAYAWGPGTRVTPAQQETIERCMELRADRPMLLMPGFLE